MAQNDTIAALDIFEELKDPRQPGKVKYPLNEIILVALCASICGADTFIEIAEFGQAKIDFLKRLLPFANGIASHDTFGAVFSNIDRKQFSELFIKWVQALQTEIPCLVAIDGKTVRRSRNGDLPPIHVLSAWASDQNLVMGQVKTDTKSNEIKAIPELLEMLMLKKALVSIDAMGCQKEIAGQIISKKADYLLSVKRNQPALYNELALAFEAHDAEMALFQVLEQEHTDKDHGRIERRIYSITWDVKNLEAKEIWPGLKCIGRVRTLREVKGKISDEVRYFISSRKLDAAEFGKAVRSHWGIENKLHWVMDVVFSDDDSRVRIRNAAANFVTLKHITLNMLKMLPGKQSMRVRRKRASWDEEYLLSALKVPLGK